MSIREIGVAAFWIASVIEVAQFTWEAFKNTYIPFPIGSSDPAKAQPAPIVPNPPAKNALPDVPKTPSGRVASPPQSLLQPVIQAVRDGSGVRALAAWTKVIAWANSPQGRAAGFNTQKLADWAFSTQGWFGRFYDLTGWTPQGISQAGRPGHLGP